MINTAYGLTTTRYQEVEQELNQMETYLLGLSQEIRETTAPGAKFNHIWLQVDSAVSYTRSLRAALQRESMGQSSETH